MASDRIDSIIDLQATEAEADALDKRLDDLLAKIKEFSTVRVSFNGAQDLSAVNDAQKKMSQGQSELNVNLKEYQKIQDQIATRQAKLNSLNSDSAQNLADLNLQIQKQTQALKDQARLNDASIGSVNQLRVLAKQAADAFDALSEAEKNTEGGRQIQQQAKDLKAALDAQEQSTLRFRGNVGNYQGSADIIVRALERARQKFDDLNRDSRASPEQVSRVRQEVEGLQRVVDQPNFLNIAAKIGDANAETRFFTKALIDLQNQGLGSSQAANDLRDHLSLLTKEIRDTHQEVKALSSDTRGFDLFTGSITSLVNVTQTAIGVQALFGDGSEHLTRSIQKLVAIQNIANGTQQLAEQLTKKGTAANKLYVFVQQQLTTLMDSGAKASARFGAALKLATPIGIAIGLFELVKATGLFGDGAEKAEQQLTGLNNELERLATLTDRGIKDLQFETDLLVEKLKQRGATEEQINDTVVGGLRKQAVAYRELAAEGLASIEKTTKLHVTQVTTLKQAETLLDALKKKRDDANFGGITDKVIGAQLDKSIEVGEKIVDNFRKATAADRAGTLQHEQFVTQQTDKDIEQARRGAAERAKAELELAKFRLGLAADQQARIAEIDNFQFRDRRAALIAEEKLREQIIQRQQAFDQGEVDRTQADLAHKHELTGAQEQALADKRILIDEKAAADIDQLERALGQKLIGIRAEIGKRNKDELQQEVEDFINAQDAKLRKVQELAQRELAERLLRLQNNKTADEKEAIDNFNNGLTTKEQLQARLAQIDAQGRTDALALNLDSLNQQLRQQREAGADTLAIEQEISDAKAQIQAEADQKRQEADDREIDLRAQKFESLLGLVQESGTALNAIIGGSFDTQKNRLQDQIDKIEELKNKEIDQINSSADTEEKKAARIKVIEAKAQADKERLEARQRELDRRKAIFDKALQAMNITIGGIEAVARIHATIAKLTAEAAANPLLLPLIPIAASQIPITIALTAAQLVALAATPIPKFAGGTDSAPAGVGIWGEVGQEMLVDRGGRIRLSPPGGASLVDLMGGETIYPADVTRSILSAIGAADLYGGSQASDQLLDRTGEVVDELKALNRKPGIIQHIERGIETTEWYQQNLKR